MRRVWSALVVVFLFTLRAAAQSPPAPASPAGFPAAHVNNGAQRITLGQSIIALTGPWKFHIGENPQWANPSFDPLEVLQSLNRRLCGRGHAHAACLALRIEADGAVTLANAGHLPPYLNGKEVPMEGALPLGMTVDAEFSVMHFQLAPGDTLLMMSDGVAEAQNNRGQLFGFERIHEMLRAATPQRPITAAEIAAAAQTFGQEDDISVLSVTRTANLKADLA